MELELTKKPKNPIIKVPNEIKNTPSYVVIHSALIQIIFIYNLIGFKCL